MSAWDGIRARLEEGRAKLGGFGEPVWSQAMQSLSQLEQEWDEARTLLNSVYDLAGEEAKQYKVRIHQLEAALRELDHAAEYAFRGMVSKQLVQHIVRNALNSLSREEETN